MVFMYMDFLYVPMPSSGRMYFLTMYMPSCGPTETPGSSVDVREHKVMYAIVIQVPQPTFKSFRESSIICFFTSFANSAYA